MKLDMGNKQQVQILVLAAIGAVAVLYVAIQFGIAPVIAKKKAMQTRIQDMQETLEKAETRIRRMGPDRQRNSEIVQEILGLTDTYVLRPRLGGNFLLGAREAIEKYARKAGVEIAGVRQIGDTDIPKKAKQGRDNSFRCYTVRIDLACGLHDLTRLLAEIEKDNPYLCVSTIVIAAQDTDPARHRIAVDIQWPIWGDLETVEKLKKQLDEAKDDSEWRSTAPKESDAGIPGGTGGK